MENLLDHFKNSIRYWYVPFICGGIFLLCGIYLLFSIGEPYLMLTIAFSLSFMISGLLEIFFFLKNSKTIPGWRWYVVSGFISLAAGLFLMTYPGISAILLPYIVGVTMLFRATLLFGVSWYMKEVDLDSWGNLTIASMLNILLSILLIIHPNFTGFSQLAITGILFISVGIAFVIYSFDLRRIMKIATIVGCQFKKRLREYHQEAMPH